jgi:hypothetical protein
MGAAQRIPTDVLIALWEQGQPPDSALIESCTSLTTEPNEWLRPIHNQMPVIPSPASYDQWPDPACQHAESLKALLRPAASEALLAYSVGTLVNNRQHDALSVARGQMTTNMDAVYAFDRSTRDCVARMPGASGGRRSLPRSHD